MTELQGEGEQIWWGAHLVINQAGIDVKPGELGPFQEALTQHTAALFIQPVASQLEDSAAHSSSQAQYISISLMGFPVSALDAVVNYVESRT